VSEKLIIDAEGRVANPTFRGYHIPAFADAPATEVHFAKTFDAIGPLGAKSMSESPYNPVAAALANAIRDATGVRLFETPFMADELYRAVIELKTPAEQPRRHGRVQQVEADSGYSTEGSSRRNHSDECPPLG
jgi:xanthine dehydrogenase molybdopterin-binding subunit B